MHAQIQTNLPQISNHLDELFTLLLVYALAEHGLSRTAQGAE